MTAADFRAQLARLGLSQTAAAHEIGVDARTVRRWCADPQQAEVPTPVVRLLAMMERAKAAPAPPAR